MSERLRIVHLVVSDKFAGVERYICTAARYQAESGHQVAVIGGRQDRMSEELQGAPVLIRPADTLAQAWAALRRLPRVDVVHAHMTAGELVAAVALPRRARLVVTRHFAQHRGSGFAGRMAGRLIARRTAEQIAISDFVAAKIEPGRTTVISPGVPDRPERPGRSRQQMVLVAQRLEVEKRTDTALRLWAASGLGDRGWKLHLAGGGAERKSLEVLADQLGIGGSCTFLGPRSDVPVLLESAAIVLAPRHDEPYGLSVVEAMAAGAPVVAGAGGGHDETVGRSGQAVLLSPDAVEQGGRRLAELADDQPRRDRYGESLRDIQRQYFSADRQSQRIVDLYHQVVNR